MLTTSTGTFVAGPAASAFVQLSYPDQIRTLLRSGMQSQRWQEWPDPPWHDADAHRQQQWRMVLLSALMALPLDRVFVAIDDLATALFARIGRTFSLAGPVNRPLYK